MIEASFFSRSAIAGCSSISMTWLAATISTFDGSVGAIAAMRAGRRPGSRWSSGWARGVVEGAGDDLGGP